MPIVQMSMRLKELKKLCQFGKKEIWEDGAEWQGHQRGDYSQATKGEA